MDAQDLSQEVKDNILLLMELGEVEQIYDCSRFILETLYTGYQEDDTDQDGGQATGPNFWNRRLQHGDSTGIGN